MIFTLLVLIVLTLPRDVQAISAVLSWQDNSQNESGFRIERQVDGGAWALVATVKTNVVKRTVTLEAGKTTCFRIIALSAAGNSAPSNTTCAAVEITK
jgi:hypothetical protein